MQRLPILGAVCILACNGHGDRKPTSIEFGSAVAPPFGLVALKGGQPKELAQKSVPSLQPDSDGLALAGAPSGVGVHVIVDHGRIADLIVGIANCDAIASRLEKAWSQFSRGDQTWSDPSTGWAADFVAKASGCELRFTHAGYFGPRPTAFGAVADLKIGLSRDEATKVLPAVASGESTIPSRALIDAKEGVLVDRVGTLVGQYYVLPRRAVEALRVAWGPGSKIPPSESTECWIATETRTHAALIEVNKTSNTWTLQLNSFVPLHDWLGTGASVAVLPEDVWTTPLSQLATLHPELKADPDAKILTLPATDWSPAEGTQATLQLDEHNVPQSASVLLVYPNTQIRRDMLSAFESKWGKASETKGRRTFEKAPEVVLEDGENAWHLTVSARSGPR